MIDAPTAVALEAKNVTMEFAARGQGTDALGRRKVHAVRNVSLALQSGTATALVGESGSGKSTLARVLAGLYRPTRGEVLLDGQAISVKSRGAFRRYSRHVQLILQDPYASLNPHRTIGYHVTRPLRIHGFVTRRTPHAEVVGKGCEILERVGLTPGANFFYKFPHELSGGQRQRASIARALAAQPRVLIADEPVSMLDVSLRRGILEIFRQLRLSGLTVLYVTHDLPSAAYFAETIAVMYAGEIVEEGPAGAVVDSATHPYTQLLLSATPDPFSGADPSFGRQILTTKGEPPSLIDLPVGCTFHPRCPRAFERCSEEVPVMFSVGPHHASRCWLSDTASGTTVDFVNVQISGEAARNPRNQDKSH